MKIEDYEKYYQKGGSYVIPTEVFNELFNELEAWKKQAKKVEMIRLDQTKKVFDTIAKVIKEGSCSYRHLIYDELGFGGKYYEELLSGMTITNAICDLEELREQHEEKEDYINKLQASKNKLNKWNYENTVKQKEFIKYLEDEMSKWHNNYDNYNYEYEIEEPTAEELVNEILQKYKSIIGVSDENNIK